MMVNLLFLLFLCWCSLITGSITPIEITYSGTAAGTGTLSGTSVTIDIVLTLKQGVYSSSSGTTWGFTSATGKNATAGLYVSSLQVTLNGGTEVDVDVSVTKATVAYLKTSGSVLTIQLNSTALATITYSTLTVSSLSLSLNFAGVSFLTKGGELVSYFASHLSKIAKIKPSSAGSLLWFSSGSSMSLTTTSIAFSGGVLSESSSGNSNEGDSGSGGIEEPQEFENDDDFENALIGFGISFGSWSITNMTITITGVYKKGNIFFAFYNADDGELGIVVLTFGKFKVKRWGNGVRKGLINACQPGDLKSATGKALGHSKGITAQFFLVIARFSATNALISNVDMQIEVTGIIAIANYYRFPEGSSSGTEITKEGGKKEQCESPSTMCNSITLIGTSSVSATTGSASGTAVKPATSLYYHGLWALLSAVYLFW